MKTMQEVRNQVRAGIRLQRNAAASRRAWSQAHTFADLGELTARFIEGSLWGHPGYSGQGPDEETEALVPVLAAANRAGFVTVGSQPGADELVDGVRWRQRAAVSGFVIVGDLLNQLARAASEAELWFVIHAAATSEERRHTSAGGDDGYRYGEAMTVTTRDGQPVTGFGDLQTEHQIRLSYGRWCNRSSVDRLADSYQITLIDPHWGRDDLLWPTLTAALTSLHTSEGTMR
jgi:hypothetical protein